MSVRKTEEHIRMRGNRPICYIVTSDADDPFIAWSIECAERIIEESGNIIDGRHSLGDGTTFLVIRSSECIEFEYRLDPQYEIWGNNPKSTSMPDYYVDGYQCCANGFGPTCDHPDFLAGWEDAYKDLDEARRYEIDAKCDLATDKKTDRMVSDA